MVRRGEQRLQIGDLLVGLQHLQRGVVPAVLIERHLCGIRRLAKDLRTAMARDQRRQDVEEGRRDHQTSHRMSCRNFRAPRTKVVLRQRRGDHAGQLLRHAIHAAETVGEARSAHQGGEGDDHIHPVPGGRERHLQLRDDAVGAVGVVDLLQLRPAQFQHARLGFHRHDLQAEDVPGLAQDAEGGAAYAGRAARDEATQRRGALGGGVEAQFPAHFPLQMRVELDQLDAGFRPHHAGLRPEHAVERRHLQHDAAPQGHRLAVIARARAARRDGHAVPVGRRKQRAQLRLVARGYHGLAGHLVELPLQHGRIPEEVARFLAHQRGIGGPVEARQGLHHSRHGHAAASSIVKSRILPGFSRPSGSAMRLKPSWSPGTRR